MFPRILPLILLVGPAFANELFSDVGGTRVLSLDLSTPPPKDVSAKLSEIISKEEAAAGTASERKAEILIIHGLLALHHGEHARAIDYLDRIAPNSLLRDVALFYRARALTLQGNEVLKLNRSSESVKACAEARTTLVDLSDQLPGYFTSAQPKEFRSATLCYARALVAEGRPEKAKPVVLSLLVSGSELSNIERQLLRQTAEKLLEKDNPATPDDVDYRRILIDAALRNFPDSGPLVSARDKLPKLSGATLIPETKGEIPVSKAKQRPEDLMLREAGGLATISKEIGNAVDIYVKIFQQYPGSLAAAKAGAKLQVLTENYIAREKRPPPFLNQLKELPTRVVYAIAKSVWEKEFPDPALELFEYIAKNDPSSTEAGNATYFIGRIYEDRAQWDKARKQFERVVTAYNLNSFFSRSHGKVGWLYYMNKEYAKALEWLEADRASAESASDRAENLYWMSKTCEKMGNKELAAKYLREIALTAPTSYYAVLTDQLPGLAETQVGTLTSSDPWTQFRIRRARSLLSVGLPAAAGEVLKEIDTASDVGSLPEVATLLRVAKYHRAGINVSSRLVGRLSNGALPRDVALAFFPVDHEDVIYSEAKTNKLDPLLLFSIIKQESAYREDAESRAGALGLMQIMPQTAKDVARDMNEPQPERMELLKGKKNIKIGTKYIASLLRKYEGNLAYALSCYNAGPNNTDLWKKRWGHLPFEEFVELIPFEETRTYVKSILRNYAFYAKVLENRKVDFKSASLVPQGL